MNLDGNPMARLMINQLPGLAGALQPSSGAAQRPSDLARRQQRQNLAKAMLVAASGMLAASPNRHPLGPLQRLGAGLGALQSQGDGGARARILEALGMDGRGVQSRTGAIAPAALKKTAPDRASSAAAEQDVTGAEPPDSARRAAPASRRIARRANAAHHKAAAGGHKLRKFSGKVGRHLDHPAVLPGGWQLYGYEKESGKPLYAGPNRELRVYA